MSNNAFNPIDQFNLFNPFVVWQEVYSRVVSASSKSPITPVDFWKIVYETSEEQLNRFIDSVISEESFAEASGKALDGYLVYQNVLDSYTKNLLQTLNLPSKTDIASSAALTVGVDEKLDLLEDRIDEELAKTNALLHSLHEKVDQLIALKTAKPKAQTKSKSKSLKVDL